MAGEDSRYGRRVSIDEVAGPRSGAGSPPASTPCWEVKVDRLDGLEDAFPPLGDNEPSRLRDDIVDELSDHLQCALARERHVEPDEDAAWRAVVARFDIVSKLVPGPRKKELASHILW